MRKTAKALNEVSQIIEELQAQPDSHLKDLNGNSFYITVVIENHLFIIREKSPLGDSGYLLDIWNRDGWDNVCSKVYKTSLGFKNQLQRIIQPTIPPSNISEVIKGMTNKEVVKLEYKFESQVEKMLERFSQEYLPELDASFICIMDIRSNNHYVKIKTEGMECYSNIYLIRQGREVTYGRFHLALRLKAKECIDKALKGTLEG